MKLEIIFAATHIPSMTNFDNHHHNHSVPHSCSNREYINIHVKLARATKFHSIIGLHYEIRSFNWIRYTIQARDRVAFANLRTEIKKSFTPIPLDSHRKNDNNDRCQNSVLCSPDYHLQHLINCSGWRVADEGTRKPANYVKFAIALNWFGMQPSAPLVMGFESVVGTLSKFEGAGVN